ncbi:MAG: replicative DNA helicase [Treponema sp.]|nr:replicative DNA helicase [Treponema sp.]
MGTVLPSQKSVGRVPPHDVTNEQAVLGAILIDNDSMATVVQYVRPADFYVKAHNKIFTAMIELFNEAQGIDTTTVINRMKQLGWLEEVGGPIYIAELSYMMPSSANVEFYAKSVQSYSLRRSLIKISTELMVYAFDETQEIRSTLEEIQQKLFTISDERQTSHYKTMHELVPIAVDILENLSHKKDHWYTGIPSGFDALDKLTNGFHAQELIIIGARPSVGKTALALSMVANIAVKNKRPVAFFTLEMSDLSLVMRLIAIEASIESTKLRVGNIKQDFDRVAEATARLYHSPLYIVDVPNMKLLDLRAQARRLKSQQKVEIIFIDYLTLISSENIYLKRHEQIAEVSRSLKNLARELDIPVVALSQLTREAEKERPNLASIRESGAIEQDADVVMFLQRERESDKKDNDSKDLSSKTNLILAKQRNGPIGTVELVFLPKYTRFESISYCDS